MSAHEWSPPAGNLNFTRRGLTRYNNCGPCCDCSLLCHEALWRIDWVRWTKRAFGTESSVPSRCTCDATELDVAQEGSGYGAAAGEAGEAGGGGGGGFDFGVDPNLDPELALALRVSLEEERARLGGQAGALPGWHACITSYCGNQARGVNGAGYDGFTWSQWRRVSTGGTVAVLMRRCRALMCYIK